VFNFAAKVNFFKNKARNHFFILPFAANSYQRIIYSFVSRQFRK